MNSTNGRRGRNAHRPSNNSLRWKVADHDREARNKCYAVLTSKFRHLINGGQPIRDLVSEIHAEGLLETLETGGEFTYAVAHRAAYRISRANGYWRKGGTQPWTKLDQTHDDEARDTVLAHAPDKGYPELRKPLWDAKRGNNSKGNIAAVERWLSR